MTELLYPAGVVLLGYVVLGITGFGSALVIVPLLAWHWPLAEVVPLMLLTDVLASALHGRMNLALIQWVELRRLLPGMALGAVAGLLLAKQLDSQWPLLLLGLYVAFVGANALRVSASALRQDGQAAQPTASAWRWPAGIAIGVVEMLFGTAGPLVVAWLSRRIADPQALRASTPVVIGVASAAVLTVMAGDGQLNHPLLWQRFIGLVVIALAGVVAGHHLARHMPAVRVRQAICGLLVLSGLAMVVRALV